MNEIIETINQISTYTEATRVWFQKRNTQCLLVMILLSLFCTHLKAQVEANGHAFNYFERQWFSNNQDGAGYSFYTSVYPIMQQYPGPENFQLGLTSTWMTPLETGNEPSDFYNTIEGGLGWWHDTRFATETPKFIMGGVANGFSQWANGPGAGSTDMLANGQRDWSTPGGKYGIAQLSNQLLWPPDGLNMEQGANGDYLGYGYHPLPLTDVMQTTNGVDYVTGNQCWTLFLNTSNFKGVVAFIVPKFWTETALDNPNLEGLFLDQRPTDKNQAFAIEYAEAPALIGYDTNGETYAHLLPLSFPATTNNSTELVKEIKVYTKDAMWDAVENWFNGGTVAPTQFQASGIEDVFFDVGSEVDGYIATDIGNLLDAQIDMSGFATKENSLDQAVAGFSFDVNQIPIQNGMFVMPEFYKLNTFEEWLPIDENQVPAATGLVVNTPAITPRSEITYVTPKESDCHIQDPQNPYNSPGPSEGPFTVSLGDGSQLTYYWYRFIDQPAIIHANLPEDIRQNLQTRVELIHTHWLHTEDNYLPDMSSGELVGLDAGQIVTPPAGMEVGYVPIVTRQELDGDVTLSVELISFKAQSFKKRVELNWQTASELNNKKFEIEESQDEREFQKIGEVEGNGTTLEQQGYSFEVKKLQNGIFYYRLKQVDYDGQFEYSEVISINFIRENREVGHFYPNPSKSGIVNLEYISNTDEEITISVFDIAGKLIVNQIQQISNGDNNLSFNFPELNTGIYIVKIGDEGNLNYRKLIIER